MGIYDGLYGPGTGTFLLLLFTGLCRLNLQDAAGTTKVINLTTNLSALAVFLVNGKGRTLCSALFLLFMVRFPMDNPESPVYLFCQDYPHQLVWKSHIGEA